MSIFSVHLTSPLMCLLHPPTEDVFSPEHPVSHLWSPNNQILIFDSLILLDNHFPLPWTHTLHTRQAQPDTCEWSLRQANHKKFVIPYLNTPLPFFYLARSTQLYCANQQLNLLGVSMCMLTSHFIYNTFLQYNASM